MLMDIKRITVAYKERYMPGVLSVEKPVNIIFPS